MDPTRGQTRKFSFCSSASHYQLIVLNISGMVSSGYLCTLLLFSPFLPTQHHPSSPLLPLVRFHACPRVLYAMPPCCPWHATELSSFFRRKKAGAGLCHGSSTTVTPHFGSWEKFCPHQDAEGGLRHKTYHTRKQPELSWLISWAGANFSV